MRFNSSGYRAKVRETFSQCHIYCDSDDVLYANKNYITFHASCGGEKVIHLPKCMRAVEVYEGTCYAECAKEIRFSIKRGETKMFRLYPLQ